MNWCKGRRRIKRMIRIEKPHITVSTGQIGVVKVASAPERSVSPRNRSSTAIGPPLTCRPTCRRDRTDRSTLVRILKESGRLGDFFNNPQRFLDAVAAILKYELHRFAGGRVSSMNALPAPGR